MAERSCPCERAGAMVSNQALTFTGLRKLRLVKKPRMASIAYEELVLLKGSQK